MDSKNGGVAIARGWTVKKIDVVEQKIYLEEDNKEISYEKCLIATGARPKNLPVFEEADEEIKEKVCSLSVSYTHLDVYKRQHVAASKLHNKTSN